jgi:thioredoxin-like negative regulator of GroEL
MPRPALSSLLLAAALAPLAFGQDTVITSTATNPSGRIKRQGTILDYSGTELRLKTTLGAEETIPAARVIEIKTTWPAAYNTARDARTAGRIDDAIASLRQAKRDERRPWAVRQIMAELAGCYLEAGRIDNAGDEFLALAASDPATRHLDVLPIAWRAAPPDVALEARATAWLSARDNPLAQLLGASWLLSTGKRGEAAAVLAELSRSSEARVAGAASIQLWRTKLVTATPGEVVRWQAQLEAMPTEIQAAGWYVLGEFFSRQSQPDQAAIAYLKVPILFREQRALAADALLAAGGQLESLRPAQAAALYREVARDFPHLRTAREAQARLDRLNGQ